MIYFGTRERMIWTKAPATGMPIGSDSWNTTGTDLNGGGFVQNSDTHNRTYEFTWGAAPLKEIYEITDYATGAYGEGPLYFLDPFAMQTNLFNDAFSAPYKLVRSGLMYGNVADTVVNVPNIFTNSNFDTPRSSDQTILTNLATNPSFEATGATVGVWRNDCPNPLMSNAGTVDGWLRRATVSSDTPVWAGDRLAVNVTADAGGVYCSIGSQVGNVLVTVTAQTPVGARPELHIYNETDNAWFTPAVLGDYSGGEQTLDGFWNVPAEKVLRIYVRLSGTLGTLTVRNVTTDKLRRVYSGSSTSPDPDLTPSWTGTVNNSPTVLSGVRPAQIISPVDWQGRSYQTGDSPVTGSKALRFQSFTDSPVGIPCIQTGSITTGTLYTIAMWVRASRSITVHPRVRAVTSGVDSTTLQPGVWTLVRTTVTAGSGSEGQTGLLLDGASGHQYGDTVDVDDFTIVEGKHPWLMPFHGGLTPDDDMYTLWTGTEDASTSTLNARVPDPLAVLPPTQRLTIQTTENTDLRIIRTDNAVQASYGTYPVQFNSWSVGKTFTAFARVRIPEGYDPTDDVTWNDSRSRSLYLFGSANTYYAQAPAVPGTYDLKMTFPVTEAGQTVRLGGGGAVGQSVYYESFYLFEGEPDFFDPRNMPRQMATDISGLTQPHYIPVPKGYKLWVAYGANAVAMVANGVQQLDPYTWYSFTTGTDFAWTSISSGTNAVGAIAIMTKNGEQRPEIEWSPGKGNSGLRFVGKPNIQGISAKLRDGLVSGSAQLREVGLWEQ